jgi:tetratricopeptide (TPR) repeat protein
LPIAGIVAVIAVVAIILVSSSGQTAQPTETLPPQDAEAPIDEATAPVEPPPDAGSEVQALIDQGYAALFTGGSGDALDLFNQALAIEPENPNALVAWAVAELWNYGDADTAGQYLDLAAQSIPDDPYLHFGYGLLYVRSDARQDPQASDAEITRAIETCGETVWLCIEAYRLRSGVRFWNLDDPDGGLADLDSAIALSADPNGAAYLHGERADLRFRVDDPDGAIEDYVAAYELNGDAEYLQRAAVVAVKIEDFDQAFEFYDRLFERSSGDPYYLVRSGYLEWRVGDPDSAAEQARRALDLNSDLIEAHYLLGLTLLDQGDPQTALAEFDIFAAETDPDRLYEASNPFFFTDFGHDIAYDKARALHALGDLDGALAAIDEALSRDDYWPQPYIERGLILTEQGLLELARENYLQARDIAADDPELQERINELLLGLSQP